MFMRFRSLLAAAVAVAALAAAPAAQASWITGRGTLPVFGSDWVCPRGMDFRYATQLPPPLPKLAGPGGGGALLAVHPPFVARPDKVTLYDFTVWAGQSPAWIDPATVPALFRGDLTIPRNPLTIPLEDIGGGVDDWVGTPGEMTHSAEFVLVFGSRVPPGTQVWIAWRPAPAASWSISTQWQFTVQGCPVLDRP